jgi:signal-transduction protein with cAMP-binding, CBS, and nucleotidyltransferase domain
MSLREWKELFDQTIRSPFENDFYGRRALFDLRQAAGADDLFAALLESIRQALAEQEMAIPLFANDTLENLPPLTFFQGLVLSLDGARSESFNLQETVLFPLASAARVFALAQGQLRHASTLARLEAAIERFPEAEATLREAADAFRVGLYYQCSTGGDRLNPSTLGKFDQLLLKTTFASIQRFLDFTVSRFIPAL